MGLDDFLEGGFEPHAALPELDPDAIDWVAGDGHLLDPWWQDQEIDGLCAPTSAAIVMSYLTGTFYDKDQVARTAVDLGLLTQSPDGSYGGMTALETERLIDSYGLDAHVETGSMNELRQLLGTDPATQVIVAVDSDEIWYRTDDDLSMTDAGADHALVVAGIDERRGTVILADPGNTASGRGYEISIAEFDDAWADSNHEMVVTTKLRTPDAPKHEAGPAVTVRAAASVIVPLIIAARAIRRVRLPRTRR